LSYGEAQGWGFARGVNVPRPFLLDLLSLALPDGINYDDLNIGEPAFSLELL